LLAVTVVPPDDDLAVLAGVQGVLVVHHVPVERCAAIIGALTGARPPDGFVHAMLARAARAVRG
jgi:hypothetical protein